MSEQDELPCADVLSSRCPSRSVLHHLTGRWGALALAALHRAGTPVRFAELRRRIDGISDRMLSQTLGQLERDGMVTRTVLSTIPPHVDYALSDLGERVTGPLLELIGTVEASMPEVLAAQHHHDSSNNPGQ